jgi:hypothetical protein
MNNPKSSPLSIENVAYDSTLNQYEHQVLFPKKLALANEMLAKYGVPDQFMAEQQKHSANNTANESIQDNNDN